MNRARYYDSKVGRFLEPDPIGFLGGVNFYAYCGNNPIRFIDSFGFCKQKKSWWEKWSIGSSYGIAGFDFGWDTDDPSKLGADFTFLEAIGAGWHITWTSDEVSSEGEIRITPIKWNVGMGEYLGVTFADDFSSFSLNIGLGVSPSPITPTIPLDDNILE
ncbi:MAG: RHS repeat-associated core domain-containing protein [bacterium]